MHKKGNEMTISKLESPYKIDDVVIVTTHKHPRYAKDQWLVVRGFFTNTKLHTDTYGDACMDHSSIATKDVRLVK